MTDDDAVPWTSMEEAWLTPQNTRQQDRLAAMDRGYRIAFERDILPYIPQPQCTWTFS